MLCLRVLDFQILPSLNHLIFERLPYFDNIFTGEHRAVVYYTLIERLGIRIQRNGPSISNQFYRFNH